MKNIRELEKKGYIRKASMKEYGNWIIEYFKNGGQLGYIEPKWEEFGKKGSHAIYIAKKNLDKVELPTYNESLLIIPKRKSSPECSRFFNILDVNSGTATRSEDIFISRNLFENFIKKNKFFSKEAIEILEHEMGLAVMSMSDWAYDDQCHEYVRSLSSYDSKEMNSDCVEEFNKSLKYDPTVSYSYLQSQFDKVDEKATSIDKHIVDINSQIRALEREVSSYKREKERVILEKENISSKMDRMMKEGLDITDKKPKAPKKMLFK